MAQDFNNLPGPPHESPTSRPINGFEDLMGSLRPPGSATLPPQGFHIPQWPGSAGWPGLAGDSTFPYNMPLQTSPLNQMVWNQNNEEDQFYNLHSNGNTMSENNPDTVRRQSGIAQPSQSQTQMPSGIPSLALPSPLNLPQPQVGLPPASEPPPIPNSPKVSSAAATARAAELRAKLLASRGSKSVSRQGSPAVKTNGQLSEAKKTKLLDILKQTNGDAESSSSIRGNSASSPAAAGASQQKNDKSNLQASMLSPTTTATSLGGAIDSLMSEARDAADASQPPVAMFNGNHQQPDQGNMAVATANGTKSRSPSELSEPGEIRSDPASPEKPVPAPLKKAAMPIPAESARREKQEKLEKVARQNEVKKAYQPLKSTKGSKPAPNKNQNKSVPQSQAKSIPPQQSRKAETEQAGASYKQMPIREEPRNDQFRESSRNNDRRDDDRDLRRSSGSQANSTLRELDRDGVARRQRQTEENARRAAEYKRNLDAQWGAERAAARQRASENDRPPTQRLAVDAIQSAPNTTASMTRKASNSDGNAVEKSNNITKDTNQDTDVVMQSPTANLVNNDEDVNDWLELTRFYDDDFRERKLKVYRKKRALDIQRAELEEEEEEIELQEKALRTRAQSVLPATRSPSVLRRTSALVNTRMPPPPLPLREADADSGIKIKDSALSAGLTPSQSSPSLKRLHAEDDTETSYAEPTDNKRLRLETNNGSALAESKQLTSPASAKTDRPPGGIKGEPLPLETRVSRYDNLSWSAAAPRGRPRTRSPEYQYRRRSLSPRPRRRYSEQLDYSPAPPHPSLYRPNHRDLSNGPPPASRERGCFNCGQHGHMQTQCKQPRRDGRDIPRGYDQYVSPAYKGKNPRATPLQNGANRSRYSSAGRAEEGERRD